MKHILHHNFLEFKTVNNDMICELYVFTYFCAIFKDIGLRMHSLVAPRTKRERPVGGERGCHSLVAPRTKRERPIGAERVRHSLVTPRTNRGQPIGTKRSWHSLVAPTMKRQLIVFSF